MVINRLSSKVVGVDLEGRSTASPRLSALWQKL